MRHSKHLWAVVLILLPALVVLAEIRTEKLKNDKVLVVERTLSPGETASLPTDRASTLVYLDAGSIEGTPQAGKPQAQAVKRGDVVFRPPQSPVIKNAGTSNLSFISIEYAGSGNSVTWGTTGLAPSYKLLFENNLARAYEVKIAAGATEPQHTHHDRVVVCLSGAELEHILTDGQKQPSSLKTGEIAWRAGATHIGHNVGKTDLWVICIEPK